MSQDERFLPSSECVESLVSVIVPAYNAGDFIEATLDSILAQSYRKLEVIVVDDGSTDSTLEIVSKRANKDSRLKIVSNQRSKGAAGARNTGVVLALGQWIAFLDSDDLWAEDALERRMAAASLYPEAQFISGDYVSFVDGGPLSGVSRANSNTFWRQHFGPALDSNEPLLIRDPIRLFIQGSLTWTGCVMIASDLLNRTGIFDERFRTSEDDHLWLRIAVATSEFVFVPNSLAYYRLRPGSLTNSGRALFHDGVAAYRDLLSRQEFGIYRDELLRQIELFALLNAYHYRESKQYIRALEWAIRALILAPGRLVYWRNFLAASLFR